MSHDPMDALERYYKALEPTPKTRGIGGYLADFAAGSSIGWVAAGLVIALAAASSSNPQDAAERAWANHVQRQMRPIAETTTVRHHSERPTWRA